MRTPVFWPNGPRTFVLQVHTKEDSAIAKRLDGARRIAYSVHGESLEVFEVRRTVLWAREHLKSLLPAAKEVWGGDWTECPDFVAGAANS